MNIFAQGYEDTAIDSMNENPAEMMRPFGMGGTEFEGQLRQTMCERKRRYDRRGARTVINAFSKQRGRHGRPASIRAYPCPFCAGWHLTKADCEGVYLNE